MIAVVIDLPIFLEVVEKCIPQLFLRDLPPDAAILPILIEQALVRLEQNPMPRGEKVCFPHLIVDDFR